MEINEQKFTCGELNNKLTFMHIAYIDSIVKLYERGLDEFAPPLEQLRHQVNEQVRAIRIAIQNFYKG